MIIHHINVENKKIHLSNISLKFDKTGIYLITGPNGSGKTSLIKEIIEGRVDISFNDSNQEKRYKENKASIIAYVPQNIESPEISIIDYLKLGNKNISEDDLLKYQDFFHEDVHTLFSKLSGGEKIKCAIVSALLKDTPYIILDEPTNHMDNGSVNQLIELIESLCSNKTFIICSHDPRLSLQSNYEYHIENNQVTILDHHILAKDNHYLGKPIAFNTKRIIFYLQNKLTIFCVFIMMLSAIASLLYKNENYLLVNYNTEQYPEQDIICAYNVGNYIDELVLDYSKYSGVDIDPNLYTRAILIDDIPTIASNQNINKVLIVDQVYFDQIINYSEDHIYYVSISEKISNGYLSITSYNTYLSGIADGRYPKDNQNEVMVSKELLERDYPNININEAINQKINLNGEQYTIVGISYAPFYVISYSDTNENYGFYEYDSSTFNEFKNNLVQLYDAYGEDISVNCMFIYCNPNTEEDTLNELVTTYPAQVYDSNTYSKVFIKGHNREVLFNIFKDNIINFGITIILMCAVIFIALILVAPNIKLLTQYYFNKNVIIKKYAIFQLVPIIIAFLVTMIPIIILSSFKLIQLFILLIYLLITIIIVLLFSKLSVRIKIK